MVKVKCLDSWQSQLTKEKEYEVYNIHNKYYLIVDDMERLVYEYSRIFTEPVSEIEKKYTKKFTINFDIINIKRRMEYAND